MSRREKSISAAIQRNQCVGRHEIADGAHDRLRSQRRPIGLFNAVQQTGPVAHAALRLPQEGAVALPLDEGNQTLQRCLNIAYQPDFEWLAESDTVGIYVNLDTARLTRFRIGIDPGHGGAEY
jgi:N-acetylmuramoyl-L-alanine amidase